MGRADSYSQPAAPDPVLPAGVVVGWARAHLPDGLGVGEVWSVDESGGEARVYVLDGDVVVKTQRPHRLRPRTSLAKEAALLAALADPLVGRIPVLFGYDRGMVTDAGLVEFIVMSRVPGQAVRHVELPGPARAEMVRQVGRLLRMVHALDPAAFADGLLPVDGDAAAVRRRLALGFADLVTGLIEHPGVWTLPVSPAEVAARAMAALPSLGRGARWCCIPTRGRRTPSWTPLAGSPV